MNLIRDRWIPVTTPHGGSRRIRPSEIVSEDIISPCSPRPDFDAVLYEFLIGLVQTTFGPEEERDWENLALDRPSEKALADAFAPFAEAFDLDHPDRPFMQETGLDDSEPEAIGGLLIDAPGEATIKANKDHFVKREKANATLCAPCAALALLTIQAFSPAGGRGTKTSLRGGGPLSTILVSTDLWNTTWSNVLPANKFGAPRLHAPSSKSFPWLAPPTPADEKRPAVTSREVARQYVFWGMPRRLRLVKESTAQVCSLCGEERVGGYAAFRARPSGLSYGDGAWLHPLSPTQENKGMVTSVKGRKGVGGYRHWVGLVATDGKRARRPALVVEHYRASPVRPAALPARLRAAGFAMDNAKVEGWYEGTIPDLFPSPAATREAIDAHAERLILGTSTASFILLSCYKAAIFDRPKDAKGEFAYLTDPLWTGTQEAFYESLRIVRDDPTRTDAERHGWYELLRGRTVHAFQSLIAYDRFSHAEVERIVKAEKKLGTLIGTLLPKELGLTARAASPEILA